MGGNSIPQKEVPMSETAPSSASVPPAPCSSSFSPSSPTSPSPVDAAIATITPDLLTLRKELHRHPELGFQEHHTAEKVAAFLESHGYTVTRGVGGTGVIGLLRGSKPGPTIALRACLDALPIVENSGLDYASENHGVMHACGHDGNMTMVLGAAAVLAALRDTLRGNVTCIFQPAEEETGGAAAMITAGALKNPDVDAIITPHNWHGLAQGVLAVKPGPVLASSDIFKLTIKGTAGHGAWPHLAVDPVVIAADIITHLQRIISREVDPLKTAALSIGKIYGGTAVNIIPETVTLEGTVRAFDPEVRDFIQTRITAVVQNLTQAARADYDLTYDRIMPPVNNHATLTAKAQTILTAAFPAGMVTADFTPGMGCEEFSLFQEQVPGLFLFIGNDADANRIIPIHAPEYIFNDAILPIGVKALCELTLGLTL